LKPNPLDVSSFSALTLLVGSFDPLKPVSDMTYNVFGGTLKLALSIYADITNQSLLRVQFAVFDASDIVVLCGL